MPEKQPAAPAAKRVQTQAVTSGHPNATSGQWSDAFKTAVESRQKILDRLEEEGRDDLWERLNKCGDPIRLTCTCCGSSNEFTRRCNRKWCPVCQRALTTKASLRYTGICASFRHPLFVTHTTKNYADCTRDFVAHMLKAHTKYRDQLWHRSKVKGGVLGLEVTEKGKGYHVHIHSVIDCKWYAVSEPAPALFLSKQAFKKKVERASKELSQIWSLCMGRPSDVHTQTCSAHGDNQHNPIAMEIIKYSIKASELDKVKGEIGPLLDLLDGSRLLRSWGSAYGRLSEFDLEKRPTHCQDCGRIPPEWIPDSLLAKWEREQKRNHRSTVFFESNRR